MNIRFFLLDADKHDSIQRIETELKYVFSDYLADDGAVQSFTGLKDASAAIAKAVENTHVVIFLADYSNFGATKLTLSRAFGFQLGCSSELLEKACASLGKNSDEDYTFSVTHAFVPPKAKVFVLDDSEYAGFAVANGNQTIVLLPLAQDRMTVLLNSQVVPYINALYHTSIDMDKLRQYHTHKLSEACAKNNIKIAAAGTNTVAFFSKYAYSDETLEDIISISPINEKRGNMPPIDYIVNLSIAAAELLGRQYGIAMSNAFYTGESPESEKTVYLAVTNERETAIREVRSFLGEDIPNFLNRCCADLCAFTVDILSNDAVYEQKLASKEQILVKGYKTAIITTASLICAICIFCGVFFSVHNYGIKDWYTGFVEWIFPGGIPFISDGFGNEANENVFFPQEETTTIDSRQHNECAAFSKLTTKVFSTEGTSGHSDMTTRQTASKPKTTTTTTEQETLSQETAGELISTEATLTDITENGTSIPNEEGELSPQETSGEPASTKAASESQVGKISSPNDEETHA